MKNYFLTLTLSAISLALAITVFAESVIEGPILITLCVLTLTYGLVGICCRHKTFKKVPD
ncbi:hypothetical protein [Streptococcus moroccensis]|uniref:Uncharacterized protein n=1 Tax=Streptococcus moroccensis TaxID=1451356 RepID=A0ABT9YP02_9STRE|nr:hypothetical protein [Streptococcus moroccensis]MDQ0221716.1 hypothetical protein [Streptococcus moroccensis]